MHCATSARRSRRASARMSAATVDRALRPHRVQEKKQWRWHDQSWDAPQAPDCHSHLRRVDGGATWLPGDGPGRPLWLESATDSLLRRRGRVLVRRSVLSRDRQCTCGGQLDTSPSPRRRPAASCVLSRRTPSARACGGRRRHRCGRSWPRPILRFSRGTHRCAGRDLPVRRWSAGKHHGHARSEPPCGDRNQLTLPRRTGCRR